MNLTKHRRAIERMYTDRVTISRNEKVVKPNKQTVLQPIVVVADQPCRLSQTSLPKDGQTEAQNDIDYVAMLFTAPEVEIKQGDILQVARGEVVAGEWAPITNTIYAFVAGEPFPPYSTHQEVGLHREGYA